jgi:hypothetical protein
VGSIFSGNFGRRNKRPYLDELERIHLPRIVGSSEGEIAKKCAALIYRHKEEDHYIAVSQARGGCFKAVARFICPLCERRCTVLYIAKSLSCYRCAGNYRCQSESPGRRAERRAHKILSNAEFDDKRRNGKISGRRWKTHELIVSKVMEAAEIIFLRHDSVVENLRCVEGY